MFLAAASLPYLTHAALPNITRLLPCAAIPGKTTMLTCQGENLQGAVDLWTSFPCERLLVEDSGEAAFHLKLSLDIGPGLGAIRLVTTNGLSALNFILVDPLPAITASTTNHSSAVAQPLSGPVAVDGVCDELRSDFYRIRARKAERISIEVVAHRFGSPLDPWLRVTDTSGREIASNDDAPGLGVDARLSFRSPSDGDYFIELRDTSYGGGPRHHYRLRIGELLPSPLPFLGSEELTRLTSAPNKLSSITEREPNDTGPIAQRVTPPLEITGSFNKPGDRDVYEFTARKDENIVFSGRSRSLGSPGDLFIRLESTNGSRIAVANASAEDEGVLTNRFNKAGTYRLVVEELNHLGGAKFDYRIAMQSQSPGFTARTETDRISVPAGESVEFEITVLRRDYDGPIQLKLEGLPESFPVTNATIDARTNSTKIRIQAPDDLALGHHFHFSLLATASVEGTEVIDRVSTSPALRAAFPAMRYLPVQLDGLIALGIAESKSTNPKPPQKKRKK